ncbi:MAG: PIN domain-containing protein [Nanoarchaeota archaeon]|nr:PIN domain-containing protein [Nanoarchaeota archaeon]
MGIKVIIDASILMSALIGKGATKELIFSKVLDLFAPEYLLEELMKHETRIVKLSGLSSDEFNEILNEIKKSIIVVPKENFDMLLEKAKFLIRDENDIEYIALSLSKDNIPIWSNDPHFKEQLIIKVFTTSELVDHLKKKGYKF